MPNPLPPLEPLTPAQLAQFRAELMDTIRSVDPELLVEQVSTSPAQTLVRYLQEELPRLHRWLISSHLLQEWCLAAQARYERRRQELLAQGVNLESAIEMARAEELRPEPESEAAEAMQLEELEREQSEEGFTMQRLLLELQARPSLN